ncbi:MAG: shikimate kinase [Deltaproteobacteria bacterium]|nr:shikimate kinase [Deltaproteobacteria bacterium]
MNKSNIILTGFMGTGKTTLGRHLAKVLGYDFVDTDEQIEAQTGQSVADIFAHEGEAAFRQLETRLVERLAAEHGLVIATGGGLVLNPVNVVLLEKSGLIVCLTAPPEELLARVSRQQHIRPLLQQTDPLAKINALLAQRAPAYAQFPQLETSGQNLNQLTQRLLDLRKTRSLGNSSVCRVRGSHGTVSCRPDGDS